MASVRREVVLNSPVNLVWDALRDVSALHTRMVPGFVVDTQMEGEDARVVRFVNGMVVRELIIDVSEQQRRVAWAAVGTHMTHYNASFQLFDEGDSHTRGVWIADLLPHDAAPGIAAMIEQGLEAMKRKFG